MAINLEGIVTWLKGWFYDKTEITGFLNNKANQSDLQTLQGTVTSLGETVAGKIDTAGTGLTKNGTTLNHSNSVTAQTSAVAKKIKYDGQGHITGTSTLYGSDIAVSSTDSTKINTALSNKANSTHTHSVTDVTDSNAHSNIGTSANANQGAINTAIDSVIGSLSSIRAIEVVSTLPTASSSTMGKLYIISENSKVNVYYTEQSGSSYSWHKMDTDILDDLSVAWSDITGNPFSNSSPSSFAGANHSHSTDDVSDPSAHTIGIGSQADDTQSTINGLIDDVLYDFGVDLATHSHNTTSITDPNEHSHIGTSAGASQSSINSNIDSLFSMKAPNNHAVSTTTYGVGTTSNYGHNKIIDNLTSSTLTNGESLSAHQGYVLKGLVDAKQDEITSIVLVPKATDANGKIIFYTGDEPS
jgi:hypothetical protein